MVILGVRQRLVVGYVAAIDMISTYEKSIGMSIQLVKFIYSPSFTAEQRLSSSLKFNLKLEVLNGPGKASNGIWAPRLDT